MRGWFLDAMSLRRDESSLLDYALTAEGASWLASYIRQARPSLVVELGSGFSTMALGYACAEAGTELMTADHDERWLTDVKAVLSLRSDADRALGLSRFRVDGWSSLDALRSSDGLTRKADLVLVDHGPNMEVRLDDLRWACSLLRRGGTIALDDCRNTTRYERRARAILLPLGMFLGRVEESHGSERWIGVARRRR
jgi:predicted O-methyltransferase YrrM